MQLLVAQSIVNVKPLEFQFGSAVIRNFQLKRASKLSYVLPIIISRM